MLKVGARGFEPPASSSRTTRATGLRYAPKGRKFSKYQLPKQPSDTKR